jgi:hypothetical protein
MLVETHKTLINILNLPRFVKKIIAIIFDLSLCLLCTWFAFYLRLDQFISIKGGGLTAAMVSVALALPVFWLFG